LQILSSDIKMSQPQLTSFFTQAKRGTRNAKSVKNENTNVDIQSKRITRSKRIAETVSGNDDYESSKSLLLNSGEKKTALPNQNTIRKLETKSEENVLGEESPSVPLIQDSLIRSTRNRRKLDETTSKDKDETDCPSPAKRNRRVREAKSRTVVKGIEAAKKLTSEEVKQKLVGVKKIGDLKKQLQKIEESSLSVKKAKEKSDAAAKKVAEDTANAKAKADYEQSAAYVKYHNLAVKDDGELPLPYSYKFLAEVFRCTDTIAAMLHNRKEAITVEKMKVSVQQMMRKNFSLGYLKQIKTVFPEAYRYAWESIVGRYGKKLAESELHISVNLDHKTDAIQRLGCKLSQNDTKQLVSDKLTPQAIVERRTVFRNSLTALVKEHHSKFCSQLDPPITVAEDSLVKFHPKFNVDQCPQIVEADLPQKPNVEIVTTAADMLEKSRALFEVNPRLSKTLQNAADGKKEDEAGNKDEPSKITPVKVRKELQGLPPKLLEKILAKEAEQANRLMFCDKEKDAKLKRLRRLPTIARIVKNTFLSEKKPAILLTTIVQKTGGSYPGHLSAEELTKDVREIVARTSSFATLHVVQGQEYLKLKQNIEINAVVKQLEEELTKEEK